MNLFLDVETTGLFPKDWKWDLDYKRFPRIVSISWKLGDEMTSTIINQRGVPIPPAATAVNGVTDQLANESQYTIDSALCWLIEDSLKANVIIGHNLYFDTSICKAAALREFGPKSQRCEDLIKGLDKFKRRDTMRMAAKFTHGWTSLENLYLKLFGVDPTLDGFTPHNSFDDVEILEKCYNAILERKLWEPKIITA